MTVQAIPGIKIHSPAEREMKAAIEDICQVFGLRRTSQFLADLTDTSVATLERAWMGENVRAADHLYLVAQFAREIRDHLFKDAHWTKGRAAAMRRWLDEQSIEFDGRSYTPREVLSSDTLARRALAELRLATE